ncbi:MAG TPA: dihydrolipoamide acetyltransferase family protein [Pseudogracilibacillus sp.]|uniref:Dihydrolipoamide acetyltransferase component of pyruvate dehydrogenase complex n=1 Tax=Candidatus Pseudogracilibacillus intestinigallinarum TaxID=2838742 RepID=A0A9D1PMU8_9BACI|nr:2-oxo acid dehydrogenase subunit E2 [Candidatus Pseudogracilibacillus intestinigallinarum]HLR41709.1 dihydrolipoamide acetyltransferase family protein [Pseudogracilibacillus sp.]
MAENIVMPKLGMTMTEGTVEEWLKEEGDQVEKGDGIFTISSEKLTQEVEATSSGTLLKQVIAAGDTATVGATIAIIGEEGEDVKEKVSMEDAPEEMSEQKENDSVPSPKIVEDHQEVSGERIFITPLARKMAKEKELDINRIKGTGGNNRITKQDIIRVEQYGYDIEISMKEDVTERVVPSNIGAGLPSMRKAIAQNMMKSLHSTAQLTLHRKARANELIAFQQELRELLQGEAEDLKLTITTFITKAVVLALKDFPKINATYQNGELLEHEDVHVGIATSLSDGLLVPVIENAQYKSIGELDKAIRDVSWKARQGELTSNLLSGSTFTITNMGATGIEYFTPILNVNEVGILGVGAFQESLILSQEGQVEKQQSIPFSLTFDHQVLDGADAAEFLTLIVRYIEKPSLLLI